MPLSYPADLDFIDSPVGFGDRAVVDRAFAAAGLRRNVIIEISDITTGVDYVRHGLGLSFLPRFVLANPDGVHVTAVTGADLNWTLSLATPSDRAPSAAASALLDLVEEIP